MTISYKLRDSLKNEDINYKTLSLNPHDNAIEILKDNLDKADMNLLCDNSNPEVWNLIDINKIKSYYLWKLGYVKNITDEYADNFIKFIIKHNTILKKSIWSYLCESKNDKILNYVSNNIDKLDNDCWSYLCQNSSDKAIEIILKKLHISSISYYLEKLIENKNNKILSFISEHLFIKDKDMCFRNYKTYLSYTYIKDSYLEILCKKENTDILTFVDKYINTIKNECWFGECFNKKCILSLCQNKHDKAIEILSKNIDKLSSKCWNYLCQNQNDKAVEFVLSNQDKLNKYSLRYICLNPNDKAIEMIINNKDKLDFVCWRNLCKNSNNKVIDMIINNQDKLDDICWYSLCFRNEDKILKLLLDNIDNLNYRCYLRLFKNYKIKSYIVIYKIIEKIDINLLQEIYKDIEFNCGFYNRFTVILVSERLNKDIVYNNMWNNSNIFTYDYDTMKDKRAKFINISELNNIRLKNTLYYQSHYNYDMVLDEYI